LKSPYKSLIYWVGLLNIPLQFYQIKVVVRNFMKKIIVISVLVKF